MFSKFSQIWSDFFAGFCILFSLVINAQQRVVLLSYCINILIFSIFSFFMSLSVIVRSKESINNWSGAKQIWTLIWEKTDFISQKFQANPFSMDLVWSVCASLCPKVVILELLQGTLVCPQNYKWCQNLIDYCFKIII